MNHTMKNRSALVRSAEAGLRREQRRRESATIFAICAVVIGTYILIQFAAQVLS